MGYLKTDFERERGERKETRRGDARKMRELGADLIPTELPDYPVGSISFLIHRRGGAFDELTRSGEDDWLKQQDQRSWAEYVCKKRFIPAVEYLRAQRIRHL